MRLANGRHAGNSRGPRDLIVCDAHLLRTASRSHPSHAGRQAGYQQGPDGRCGLRDIVIAYGEQRRPERKIGVERVGYALRDPFGRGNHQVRPALMLGRNDDRGAAYKKAA